MSFLTAIPPLHFSFFSILFVFIFSFVNDLHPWGHMAFYHFFSIAWRSSWSVNPIFLMKLSIGWKVSTKPTPLGSRSSFDAICMVVTGKLVISPSSCSCHFQVHFSLRLVPLCSAGCYFTQDIIWSNDWRTQTPQKRLKKLFRSTIGIFFERHCSFISADDPKSGDRSWCRWPRRASHCGLERRRSPPVGKKLLSRTPWRVKDVCNGRGDGWWCVRREVKGVCLLNTSSAWKAVRMLLSCNSLR